MESVLRVTIIYIALMIGLRVLGKREFGQLSPLELVSLLLIPELVSSALQSEDFSMIDALVGVCTLFSLTLITSILTHQNRTLAKAVDGVPTVLAYHGNLASDNMNHERVTADEVFTEMHKAGLERLNQVAWAILETDGTITVIAEPSAEEVAHPSDTDNMLRS